MKLFVLFAILAVFSGSSASFRLNSLAEDFSEDRIVGGSTAKRGQFPHQVSLRTRENIHKCGGSIISNHWIVSAAHCTRGYSSPSELVAVVGAHHIKSDGHAYNLSRLVAHPEYVFNGEEKLGLNDIALLKTSESIKFTDLVKPIALRKQYLAGGEHTSLTVSGWGWVYLWPNFMHPTHLQFMVVRSLTNEDCRARLTSPTSDGINNGTLCGYSQKNQGVCSGDYGSPVTSNGQLVGLVQNFERCMTRLPDRYTRLSTHLTWIRKVSGVVAA